MNAPATTTGETTVISLCNTGMACVAIGAGVLPVYLTTFAETFGGLAPDLLGQLPALLFGGFVLGILISGPAADRLGEKGFAVGGAALCALGLWAAALAQDFRWLLFAAGIIGFGAGVLDMLMSPIVAAVSIHRRAAALNRLHAYYSIGVVATVAVASLSLYMQAPWRLVLAALGILPAAVAAGFFLAAIPPMVHPGHERRRLRVLLLSPRFHLAMAIIFLIGATEEGMSQWLPAYAEEALGFSKGTAGMALCGYAVLQSIGRLLGSTHAAHRMNPYTLIILGGLLSIACYLAAAWAPLPLAGLAACMLAGLACSVLWPTHLGITADHIPTGGGSMFGVLAAAGNLGCMAAPWLEGQIAAASSLQAAVGLAAVFPLLMVLLTITSRRADAAHAARA